MVNISRFIPASGFLLLIFTFLQPMDLFGWGFYAHKKINRMAVFALPKPLFYFYKSHIKVITDRAVQADKRRYAIELEAPCHYIDLDKYNHIPIDSIPRDWNSAVEKFGVDSLYEHGIVPWKIQMVYWQLRKAFIENDHALIIKFSADLGHYVGDAHVPLHCTSNYNGQQTDQYGIHALWESRLPELFGKNYDCLVDELEFIDDVKSYSWEIVHESSGAVDSVLAIEKIVTNALPDDQKYIYESRGQAVVRTYSRRFSDSYHQALSGMVERRFNQSVSSVASLWYSAWVDAGQPELTISPLSLEEEAISDSLRFKSNKIIPGHTD